MFGGSPPRQATCHTTQSPEGTRREYMFVNPDALSLVTGFIVRSEVGIPTHSALRLSLKLPKTSDTRTINHKPYDLHQKFQSFVKHKLSIPKEAPIPAHSWRQEIAALHGTMENIY